MKLPHAVGLGLLGWYLLLAPFRSGAVHSGAALQSIETSADIFDFEAPLSQWQKSESFTSESDCQTAKAKLYNDKLAEMNQAHRRRVKRALGHELFRLQYAQCVSGNDSHLQKK